MPRTACLIALLLAAPLQAREWSLGVDLPLDQGGTSLWNTGEQGGYVCPLEDLQLIPSLQGPLTLQRWGNNVLPRRDEMRPGAGISRGYKDFGVFLSYEFGYEGWDGDGIYERVGLDAYPRE